MKYLIGLVILLSGISGFAQEPNSNEIEQEQQVLVDKVHEEPMKLESKKEKSKSSTKKKHKKHKKNEKTEDAHHGH